MRIDKLAVKNFKNFSSLSVDFTSGVNLFVGSNGSGKTAILEAINVAAGGFFSSQESKLQRLIDFDEIKITQDKREVFAEVAAESLKLEIAWKRTIKGSTKTNDSKDTKQIGEYGNHFFISFEVLDSREIAPLIAYYSTQRLFKDSTMSSRQRYDIAAGRRNGYLQCLKNSAIKGLLNDWISSAVTLRASLQHSNIPPKQDKTLDNVESAIKLMLKDFVQLNGAEEIRMYPNPFFNNELYVYLDAEHDLPISYYSDGFRNLIYLVFDMVWRASQLNPWLTLEEISELVNGVVTIDEIDLHLHPKWQAMAIKLLQTLFPNVQFFITTHSPSVVANFENGALYVIDNNTISRSEDNYFGKQVNSILRNILGAYDRHRPTQNKLDKLFRLIDDNRQEEYRPLLQELVAQLGQEDPDIQKAEALISMKELDYEDNELHI